MLRIFFVFFALLTLQSKAYFQMDDVSYANNQGIYELAKLVSSNGTLQEKEWGFCVKNPSQSTRFNFCFFKKPIEPQELPKILQDIQNFYGKQPHSLIIDNQNTHLLNLIDSQSYQRSGKYPGLHLRIRSVDNFSKYSPLNIIFQRVGSLEGARQWARITASAHNLKEEDIFNFCKTNLSNSSANFYIAYHNDTPVSTRLMIVFDRNCTGYFSSTLDEYRRRGVAAGLLSYALEDLKKRHSINLFVIQALSGPIVWKKFGMVEHKNNYIELQRNTENKLK